MKKPLALFGLSVLVCAGLVASGCLGSPPPPPTGSCDKGSVTFGTILSYSGQLGSIAKVMKQGMQVAVDDINANGCINGKKLTLDILGDDRLDQTTAVQVYREMVGKGYKGIIGSIASSVTQSIINSNEDDPKGAVLISSASTAVILTNPSGTNPPKRFFRTIPNDGIQGPAAATAIVDKLGFKKIGLLYQDEIYGQGLKATFVPALTAKGGSIVAEGKFPPQTVSFTQEVDTVLAASPDVIFIPAFFKEQAYLVGEIRAKNPTVPIVCSEAFENHEIFQITPQSKLQGTYFMKAAVDEANAGVKARHDAFVTNYSKKPGFGQPDAFADYSYDAVIVIAEALRAKGDTASADDLQTYIHGATFKSTITREISFQAIGDIVGGSYDLYKITGTDFVPA
ncbi:MAG TPA: branched-chain amino acid ABC transporter substrate-binding protein [Thermoplasmata archaeon]|nr:branched-chain amino acid ABC transporter substrate-binding protein [Thermoplasmata archaeon]